MAINGDTDSNGYLDIEFGGTNAGTAASARTNLGVAPSVLDLDLSDGSYNGFVIDDIVTGETLAVGDEVYLSSAGKWMKTDADSHGPPAEYPSRGTVVAVGGSGADQTCTVLLFGTYRKDSVYSGFSIGDTLYLDKTTAGGVTATAPSSSGDVVQAVGFIVDKGGNKIAAISHSMQFTYLKLT